MVLLIIIINLNIEQKYTSSLHTGCREHVQQSTSDTQETPPDTQSHHSDILQPPQIKRKKLRERESRTYTGNDLIICNRTRSVVI